MSRQTIYDPALEPYSDELRRFNALPADAQPAPPPAQLEPAEDRRLPHRPEVGVRIMRPRECRAVFLHIHPGGFVMGSPSMSDPFNSQLVREASVAVVSVDYRLAPQHPHPAAPDDCEAAALWLLEGTRRMFGTERILIGGESAGASLSVLTLLRLRDRHGVTSLRAANLSVGNYDFSRTPSQRSTSDPFFVSQGILRRTLECTFPGLDAEMLRDPGISPLYADLRNLPPALFSVGTNDAMLDDSLFMAMRWRAAGNEAQLEVYPEGTHLFMNQPTAMAREANRRVVEFVRQHS